MKTKLVYVLTCAPEATYIEQALMAVWSARYHNPDAQIVLLTDDRTDAILTSKRGEILNYISEKIVVPFDADKNMHYRSRWLKTSVREHIKGDYLFIDCDTIVTCDLSHIEQVDADIAMVRDENLDVAQHSPAAARYMKEHCGMIGLDVSREKYYFNSGVMYVKDTPLCHQLYKKWHDNWLDGVANGLNIDQPTFAKANIELGRPVALLEDRWNTIVQSKIEEIYSAYILHFWHSVSFLYQERFLTFIAENGITEEIKYYLLHPTETFMPSDSHISTYDSKQYRKLYACLKRALKWYGRTIDASFENLSIGMRSDSLIHKMLHLGLYRTAAFVAVLSKFYRVKYSKKFVYKYNEYAF